MRATKAYIASLGTTGILLAASILMLAVVSAVVAFDRWPDGRVSTGVQTLVLDERPAAIQVRAGSAAPSATPSPASTLTAGAPAGTRVVARGRLLVGDENLSGERTQPNAQPQPGAQSTPLPKVAAPDPTPILDAISNPGSATSQVADGAQAVTDGAAETVGGLSPDAGEAVAATGEAAADALRRMPLPQHVLPGH